MHKIYGTLKPLYGVVERKDGWIDLIVLHKNKEIRKYLERHKKDTKYLLVRKKQYAKNNLTAKKWLAKAIDDYSSCFDRGRVKFIFK